MAMLNNQRVPPYFSRGFSMLPITLRCGRRTWRSATSPASRPTRRARTTRRRGKAPWFSLRKGAQMATNRGEVVDFPHPDHIVGWLCTIKYHKCPTFKQGCSNLLYTMVFPIDCRHFWLVRSPSSQTSLALGWRHWKRTPSKNRTNRWGGWDFDWRKFGIWPILTSNNIISATKNQDWNQETWWFEQQTGGFHQESCVDFTSTDGEKKHQHMVSWVCPCGFVEWGPMNNGYPELYDISWVKGVILNHGPWGVPCFQATSLATIHDEVLVVSSRSLVFHGFFGDHIIPVLGGSS